MEEGHENKGPKVKPGKIKFPVSGKECDSLVSSGEYPCGVCGIGVGLNFVLCTEDGKLTHKLCFELQSVTQARDYDYVCPTCEGAGLATLLGWMTA